MIRRASLWLFLLVAITLATYTPASAQAPSVVGQWSPVAAWPFINTHSVLLPTGKVLWWPSWAAGDNPTLWDPISNTNTPTSHAGYNIFCAGLAVMGNGQVLITGGDASTSVGPPTATIYDPSSGSWTQIPDMNAGRWYPTNTPLPNGDVLVTSGEISPTLGNDPLAQIWQTSSGTWRNLTSAQLALPLYPEMYLTPSGNVFYGGPVQPSRYLNTTGTGGWTLGPIGNFGTRDYGPSVTYAPGKVIVIGGGIPPTATAETIDLGAAVPAWTYTASMNFPRRQANATVLPDGSVLVTGGSSGASFDDSTHPVYPAELWNPTTGSWTVLASLSVYRGYHSIALLLPDGRVLSAGGSVATAEIFSPPYLFKGPRPAITSAPTTSSSGQTFFVGTPDAASITQVSLIRLGATTHTFNENQGVAFPSFAQTGGGLNVTLPSNSNLLPNGDYMLFLLNGSGVPSIASFLRVTNTSPAPPPGISLSRTWLTFPLPERVGAASGSLPLTVSNLGAGQIVFNGSPLTGPDFTVANTTCGGTLAAGSSCQIGVAFQPKTAGPLSETLTLNDSDPSSPQIVALNGTAGALKVSSTSFNLGTVNVGKTGSLQAALTLTNAGSSLLTFTGWSYSGSEFTEDPSSTCGSSLAASSSCVVNTNFTPNAPGARTGSLTIVYPDPASPTTILFAGTGTTAGALKLSSTSLNLGTVNVGTTGSTKAALTLTNSGSSPIGFTSFTYSDGEFNTDPSSTCGSSLAASSSCVVNIAFTPNTSGTRTGTLTIVDSDPTSPSKVTLTGVGGTPPALQLSATSLNLGTVNVGTTGSTKAALTLTNTGSSPIGFTSFTYSDGEFNTDPSSTCGSSLAASSSCVVNVAFTPNTSGTRTGTLTIVDSDPSSPSKVTLTGVGGTTPALKLSATSFNLGTVNVGTTGSIKAALTLTNTGSSPIGFTSFTYSDGEFNTDPSSTCGSSLAASSSCVVNVAFTPNTSGTRNGTLTIVDSDPTSPSKILLAGVGTLVKFTPSGLAFGHSPVNHTSPSITLTLTNVSTSTTLNISQVSLGGANPGDFAIQANSCAGAINPGGTCTLVGTFTATAVGSRSATLSFVDDGGASPQVIQLIGTGTAIRTSTNLTVNVNPSTSGQTITFTATISPNAATGSVQFLDGSNPIGTATLNNGTATLATAALSTGTHSITAVYGGDAIDSSSTSTALQQTVN
jgi:hypothetical protein